MHALFFCIVGPILSCPQLPSAEYIGGKGEMLPYAAQYQARDAWNYALYAVPLQQPTMVFVVPRRG